MTWRPAQIAALAGLLIVAGLCLAIGQPVAAQSTRSTGAAAANTAAQNPLQVPAAPHATSAAFGDWVLQCQQISGRAKKDRVCAVSQIIQMQGYGRVAQLSLQRPPGSKQIGLFAYLPANILLPGGVAVGISDKDRDKIELGWRYCLPSGCAAERLLKARTLEKWRTKSGKGRISYKNAAGQDAVIPFSFRGLAQALDAWKRR